MDLDWSASSPDAQSSQACVEVVAYRWVLTFTFLYIRSPPHPPKCWVLRHVGVAGV